MSSQTVLYERVPVSEGQGDEIRRPEEEANPHGARGCADGRQENT